MFQVGASSTYVCLRAGSTTRMAVDTDIVGNKLSSEAGSADVASIVYLIIEAVSTQIMIGTQKMLPIRASIA